jgi:hypothetical protein
MDSDRDRRRQHDLSRANIVRAQVLFLCSTINDENWEEKLEEFKKVSSFAAVANASWKKSPVWKPISPRSADSLKSALPEYSRARLVHPTTPVSSFVSYPMKSKLSLINLPYRTDSAIHSAQNSHPYSVILTSSAFVTKSA